VISPGLPDDGTIQSDTATIRSVTAASFRDIPAKEMRAKRPASIIRNIETWTMVARGAISEKWSPYNREE
jgi:hypothetical protein